MEEHGQGKGERQLRGVPGVRKKSDVGQVM